ncbi:hypothetical protein LTR41_011087 [Exophiala xenobiotica]|nr:hypothetical protein LTR41_011087 [Exophiala xenobiotica]
MQPKAYTHSVKNSRIITASSPASLIQAARRIPSGPDCPTGFDCYWEPDGASVTDTKKTEARIKSIEEEWVERREQGLQSVADLPSCKDLLTWKNLEKLNSETASKISDSMAEKKRTLSRRSSTAEMTLGVNKLAAEEMLIDLQYEGELLSSPTLPALNMLFPISGRRGESYATGTYENKQPLAFSVTYEGPIMLLWLHYITWLENARFYNMHVPSICHTTIQSIT